MKNLANEVWKSVIGYEQYIEVSTFGRIRSLRTNRFLSSTNGSGYVVVNLKITGRLHGFYVHRIVAQAFIGQIPKGARVHHINGNRRDNKVANLRICSSSEHSILHGLIGEGHPRAILTEQTVREIHRRVSTGESEVNVALSFGIRQNRVSDIVLCKIWKSLGLNPVLGVQSGERANNAKLSKKQVEEIRACDRRHYSLSILSKHYKVSTSTICHILKGRTWMGK
jgi:hypothetical protein